MNFLGYSRRSILIFVSISLSSLVGSAQQSFYWVGGSGDWTDINHWVKNSGGFNLTGSYPSEDDNAVIDANSGLTSADEIKIPPGIYAVNDMTVSNNSGFKLLFDGSTFIQKVEMNVHGDLDLSPNFDLAYTTDDMFNNIWKFVSTGNHNIETGNQDLLSVEFLTAGGTYNQLSNLKALRQIRMHGGTWNSNGHNVNTGILYFFDGASSGGPQLQKVFNAGSSNILCEEWDSDLTYGSLSVTGNHTIFANKFDGSPAGAFDDIFPGPFSINELHLLEYPDNPSGGVVIEHNNFECTDCIIESMVIEDTGRAKLAGKFTVNGKLTVVNEDVSVEFNAGNGRSNEVTLNGTVVTPKATVCGGRTVFTNVHSDFTSLLSSSGTLTIEDAELVNIQASGGATFFLSNGVLQGSSSGWNVINNPSPTTYIWVGATGVHADWNNPNNWVVGNAPNGCVPSIVDDVFIDENAKGSIRIPSNYTATCRNFIWTNQKSYNLLLDGTTSLDSELKVSGNFELNPLMSITAVDLHLLLFSSATSNTINTKGVLLPSIRFVGDIGEWTLQDGLTCDEVFFEAGTLRTDGHGFITDYWSSVEDNPKHFDFASSRIIVNGELALSRNANSGVTVDAGTSLIECESLNSSIIELYDVKLNNTPSRTLQFYPYNFNKLILNGSGQVTTQHDLTLEVLEFEADNSVLVIDEDFELKINSEIRSLTSQANPGVVKSKTPSFRAEINSDGNLCSKGYVSFIDIQAVNIGVFHAPTPFGIDGGNNDAINFDDGTTSNTLYWIGEDGGTWQVRKNWSRVDGGCSATKDPSDSPNLEFNRNSFKSSPVSVTIPEGETANNIYFKNSEELTIDVRANLMVVDNPITSLPGNIFVHGGYVNFVGKTLDVVGKVDIQSSGFMTTDMTNFTINELDSSSGALIVRNGSLATIRN